MKDFDDFAQLVDRTTDQDMARIFANVIEQMNLPKDANGNVSFSVEDLMPNPVAQTQQEPARLHANTLKLASRSVLCAPVLRARRQNTSCCALRSYARLSKTPWPRERAHRKTLLHLQSYQKSARLVPRRFFRISVVVLTYSS